MKKTIRMMLVDDEMLMMDGMAAMLADLDDIEIVARVTDARIALDVAKRMAPDIILVDVLMQTGNGVSLTSRLRQMAPWLRILGCSTSTALQLIDDMLRAGARWLSTGYLAREYLLAR
jgi:DNA-binding NarL/FixJ family response regulator